jgi:hypothetical protein
MVLRPIFRGTNGSGQRKCRSWIESFLAYTSEREGAPIWRRWVAIGTIAAVLERKAWIKTKLGPLFSNHYIILVGHPGLGKSDSIKAGREMLRELEQDQMVIIAPKSVTSASLLDKLATARRVILRPGQHPPTDEYNALVILTDEFSTIIHKYDHQFMTLLTDIYEGDWYDEERRHNPNKIKIEFPLLNILSGTTPSNLCKFMPEGAWDQGFASRTILVYSGDRHISNIFNEPEQANTAEYDDLLYDLRLIGGLYGNFVLSPEAKAAFQAWREAGEPPVPKHPKLTHYATRRTAHVLRLCVVVSASKGDSRTISLDDFEEARGYLVEAEGFMPDIFLAGTTGGDGAAMNEVWWYVEKMCAKGKEPMEHEAIHLIRERVPAHSVLKVLEVMIADGSLKRRVDPKTGFIYLQIGPRKPSFG